MLKPIALLLLPTGFALAAETPLALTSQSRSASNRDSA